MLRFGTVVFVGLLIGLPMALAVEQERPIPQNPERQKQRMSEMLAWNRKTIVDAYEQVGKKNPRWDALARDALEAAVRYFSGATDPMVKHDQVYALVKRVRDAGCDDPYIIYLEFRFGVGSDYPGDDEYERRQVRAALAMQASAYPAFRRFAALDDYAYREAIQASEGQDVKERAEAFQLLDATLDLVVESRAHDERNLDLDHLCYETARLLIQAYRALGDDYPKAFSRIDKKYAKAENLKAIRLLVKGDMLTSYAWEARGNGIAANVAEANAAKFVQCLEQARDAFEEAWALEPGNPDVATEMLIVELGIGDDRNVMEKWFERAMTGNGNNLEACQAKLNWLDPKWHGTPEELVAFGRACRDTGNWRSRIPLLLVDAHFRLAQRLPSEEQLAYYQSSKVWEDIKDVYEEHLSHVADDTLARGEYAAFSVLSGRYAVAKKQFDLLGEKLAATDHFPLELLQSHRQYAAQALQSLEPLANLPPAPKGFRPLQLEWDDPSGATGVVHLVKDCLATAAGVDVLYSQSEVFLLRDGKRAVRVFHNDGRPANLEPACFDGRYVWVPVRLNDEPPFLLVIEPKTDQTWKITIDDGLPVKRAEDLPENAVQFVEVGAIEPGKVCVVGSHVGSWIASVSFDPEKGKSVALIHEADEAPNEKDREHWKKATLRFRPAYMATLTDTGYEGGEGKNQGKGERKGPRRLILVGRYGSSGINDHPLIVDSDARSVTVLQRAIRFVFQGSIMPGNFAVHEGAFYWVEPFAGQQRTLMRISLSELNGKPLVRRLGPVEKVAFHGDRIELVGEQWWEANLANGEARSLGVKVPWASFAEFVAQARNAQLTGSEPTKVVLRLEGICESRHLGVLAICRGPRNRSGVTYQVDPVEAKGTPETAPK